MKRKFTVTLDVVDGDPTRPNIWRDWVEGQLRKDPMDQLTNIEVAYVEEAVWYVDAYKDTNEILGVGVPATLDDVRIAIDALGLDSSLVEQIDEGCFHIPLPAAIEDLLESRLSRSAEFEVGGVHFSVEMP